MNTNYDLKQLYKAMKSIKSQRISSEISYWKHFNKRTSLKNLMAVLIKTNTYIFCFKSV